MFVAAAAGLSVDGVIVKQHRSWEQSASKNFGAASVVTQTMINKSHPYTFGMSSFVKAHSLAVFKTVEVNNTQNRSRALIYSTQVS